jgi:hypothetical protein
MYIPELVSALPMSFSSGELNSSTRRLSLTPTSIQVLCTTSLSDISSTLSLTPTSSLSESRDTLTQESVKLHVPRHVRCLPHALLPL